MGKTIIIGSGFAGLSAACFLARDGEDVTVIEKNSQPGGRARAFSAEGFTFDMGPSWYWMPDVFERFFNQFNTSATSFYDLKRLDPSYQVYWQDETAAIPAHHEALLEFFEHKEKGAAGKLDEFLKEAAYKYNAGINRFVHLPGLSVTEFMHWDVVRSLFKIDMFHSMHKHVRNYFKNEKLLQLVEFPILFLGALPENTPALYSLMNYADMKLGTWYPMGGMVQIVNAMYTIANNLGVKFIFNEPVLSIRTLGSIATGVTTAEQTYLADTVVAACDYHHAEQSLLAESLRNYSTHYWDSRDMAPSCLIFYIGISEKITGLQHHNLFFDAPFEQHAAALYTDAQWPEKPLMYVCCPSKTDATVAPDGCENLFILIPVAPGLKDDAHIRESYFDIALARIEKRTGSIIKDKVVYKRNYAHYDFVNDYNAYKGNAYGLANTLKQTANLKPSIKNKKLRNLYYTGQLTVPGPGVPPALISGEVVAKQILRDTKLKMAVR